MKKIWKYLILSLLVIVLASCNTNTNTSGNHGSSQGGENGSSQNPENGSGTQGGSTSSENPSQNPNTSDTDTPYLSSHKIIVVYFSQTGNTEKVANTIRRSLGECTTHKIEASVPYTASDINYNTDCRANKEQNDPSARPEIANSVDNFDEYDIVFLGYPIWWGVAPKILYTFVENNNLSGKIIIPFCTSGSSGVGGSVSILKGLKSDNGTWKDGRRFSSGASQNEITSWINSMDLGISVK